MPRVSICIPAYKPDFFETALKSAVSQSYEDTEIIVSDDCPTDAIEKICGRYADKVRYSRNSNPGEVENLVRVAGLANGEYIKYLFDDDVMSPFCVQFLFEALEQTRAHGSKLAFSPRYTINEHNHVTSLINHFKLADSIKVLDGRNFIRLTAINLANLIGEYSSVLLRREDCIDDHGEFSLFKIGDDGIFHGVLDLTAWINLAKKGSLVGHPHPLSYYRQHSNSVSNPSVNALFIHGVLHYEDIVTMAATEGYLQSSDLSVSYQRLFQHYSYWVKTFPELNERLDRVRMILGSLKA